MTCTITGNFQQGRHLLFRYATSWIEAYGGYVKHFL